MIKIIKDIELINDIFKYDVILVGTSIYCSLSNGFQHDIKINFPIINDKNNETPYADSNKLGKVVMVNERGVIFCLCYINKGRYRPDINPDYLDYNALYNCLKFINNHFKGKKIATTLIGGTRFDGDGNYDRIIDIINETCTDVDITIYDYKQESTKDKNYREWQYIKNKIGKISKNEYFKLKKDLLWKRKHGIWNPQ